MKRNVNELREMASDVVDENDMALEDLGFVEKALAVAVAPLVALVLWLEHSENGEKRTEET